MSIFVLEISNFDKIGERLFVKLITKAVYLPKNNSYITSGEVEYFIDNEQFDVVQCIWVRN